MWPFSNNEEVTVVIGEDDAQTESDIKSEMIEVEEARTKEYTEYTAIAKFVDGTEEEYVFDDMRREDGFLILGDYIDVLVNEYNTSRFEEQVNVFIPCENLKSFETTNREKKEMEYTVTAEEPKSEVE